MSNHADHEFCDARLGCVLADNGPDLSGLTETQAAYYTELLKIVAPTDKRFLRIIKRTIAQTRERNARD